MEKSHEFLLAKTQYLSNISQSVFLKMLCLQNIQFLEG